MSSAAQQSIPPPLPGIARLVAGLEIFLGLGALFGGGALLLAPDGHLVVLAGLGSLAWVLYLVLGAAIAAVGLAWKRAAD